ERLASASLNIASIKVMGAQTFIDSAKTASMQKGASHWCTQIGAKVRDLLLDAAPRERSLLIDNDAVSLLIIRDAPSLSELEGAVLERLLDASEQLSREFIWQHFPRLLPYYYAARQDGQRTAAALPDLGVRLTRISLLDLATRPMSKDYGDLSQEQQRLLSFRSHDEGVGTASVECSGRTGELRLSSADMAVPIWYNPGRNEGYGFSGIAFSLAEQTFSAANRIALKRNLEASSGRVLTVARTQNELAAGLANGGGRLAYLKLDGDDVGALFHQHSLLARPALSIRLEEAIRGAYFNAVAVVSETYEAKVAPADLVYFGGDDLLVVVPCECLKTFVDAMATGL
ncbi:MAG: hypothetical protein KAG70_00260, partial [Alcanivorax sp.]|nr:hypothetical protein [Alcanivorax sp.]